MKTDFRALLLDESPDAVIATTPEGTVLFWSKGAEAIFGYLSGETLGRDIDGLIVPAECRGEEKRHLDETLRTGASTHEAVRTRKDGSPIYVDITRKAVRDASGAIEFVLSSKKDITHLRVMRDAKGVEARFRDILESMPDGIVLVNLTGRIVFVNSQAKSLFGYSAGELQGKAIEALLPERFRRAHVGHRSEYFSQPRTRTMGRGLELYGLRRDGTEFPVEISLSPLKTEEGTLAMSAIRDITERKRFERALHEKNVELGLANDAKDRFLASMSHELRTPLNAIIGFTGTLLMRLPGPLNAEQEKQLKTVQTGGRHLLALINDLLDLAKIEAGKVELRLEPSACHEVIEEVASALRPLAEAKGLQFIVDMPAQELVLRTDRRALSQIILNLASNAIKFTERGSVRIRLSLRESGPTREVVICVEDTGIGIGREDGERLFAAFAQLDAAQRRHEGTGLGLHLSQKLAELLGGRIAFSSEPGKGSAFTLALAQP
jgi:PAS domain S-box-containing protein